MKKNLLAVLVASFVLFIIFHGDEKETRTKTSKTTSLEKAKKSSQILGGKDSSKGKVIDKTSLVNASQLIERNKLHQEYVKVLQRVEDKLKAINFDFSRLSKEAALKGPEAFYKNLSVEEKVIFNELHQIVRKMQDHDLASDGYDRSFFKKFKVNKPDHIKDREEELAFVKLTKETRAHVEKVQAKSGIADDDIRSLVRKCNEEKDCIEKSVYLWIKANHLLTEYQFKLLNPYL